MVFFWSANFIIGKVAPARDSRRCMAGGLRTLHRGRLHAGRCTWLAAQDRHARAGRAPTSPLLIGAGHSRRRAEPALLRDRPEPDQRGARVASSSASAPILVLLMRPPSARRNHAKRKVGGTGRWPSAGVAVLQFGRESTHGPHACSATSSCSSPRSRSRIYHRHRQAAHAARTAA